MGHRADVFTAVRRTLMMSLLLCGKYAVRQGGGERSKDGDHPASPGTRAQLDMERTAS